MVRLAFILGFYSYAILGLGLLGRLAFWPVVIVSAIFLGVLTKTVKPLFNFQNLLDFLKNEITKDKIIVSCLLLLFLQALINLSGAISPELSFDALWYHLTEAKLYAGTGRIFPIKGELLWPSNLPRLMEMFYAASLVVSDEIAAKLIHYLFGIFSAIALFKLLKRYLNLRLSFLGTLIFYTMLIVGWQSTTAYVDLTRAFFEILALDLFLQWTEKGEQRLLVQSAIMTGLSVGTKILSFGTLLTFIILIFFLRKKERAKKIILFTSTVILSVSPWLILSFLVTGNPIFPLFGSGLADTTVAVYPGVNFWRQRFLELPLFLWQATIYPDDIISPVFLLFFPLVLVFTWKEKSSIKTAFFYFILAVFFSPQNSNRYLLPYLPALILVIFFIIPKKIPARFFIGIIFFSVFLNFGGRAITTKKFLPYLLGKESKSEFLAKNLNFSFGDFYDIDGYFSENIKNSDLVLIYDIHNLYYVNFPFVHKSWQKEGEKFTHILVREQSLPEKYKEAALVYENKTSRVKLYKL